MAPIALAMAFLLAAAMTAGLCTPPGAPASNLRRSADPAGGSLRALMVMCVLAQLPSATARDPAISAENIAELKTCSPLTHGVMGASFVPVPPSLLAPGSECLHTGACCYVPCTYTRDVLGGATGTRCHTQWSSALGTEPAARTHNKKDNPLGSDKNSGHLLIFSQYRLVGHSLAPPHVWDASSAQLRQLDARHMRCALSRAHLPFPFAVVP